MSEYQEAYIKYWKSYKDLNKVINGFWDDLCAEVNHYLDGNDVMSVEEACESVINDGYWGPFHMHMFVEGSYHEYERTGVFWEHFIEDFQEFMDMKAPKILMKAWEKKYPQGRQ